MKTCDVLGNVSPGLSVTSTPDVPAVITGISPVTCDIAGGLSITITGSNFDRVETVRFGGMISAAITVTDTTIICTAPPNAEGDVDVTVAKTSAFSVLKNGFKYIDQDAEHIGWANLQWPSNANVPKGTPVTIYGRVFKLNVTETAGAPPGIIAQLGYGPQGSDPRNNPEWTWLDAAYNMQYGNNDEFMKDLAINQTGTFVYCYRFSDDNGVSFVYGDIDGTVNQSGVTNGFNPVNIGYITVY